jgi:hypothetical protein
MKRSQDDSFGCLTVFRQDPCEQCHFKNRKSSENSSLSKEEVVIQPSKIAKIELNGFLLRKLKERLQPDRSQSTIRDLTDLRDKFDRIVSHISDFSFLADTISRAENFKLYT